MRLFRTPWAYLAWLAMFLLQIWRDLHPHISDPGHQSTRVAAGIWSVGNLICMSLAFASVRLTQQVLEKAALGFLALEFLLSSVADLQALGHLQSLPSLHTAFLAIDSLLAFLTAIRFIQVLNAPRARGILSGSPSPTE